MKYLKACSIPVVLHLLSYNIRSFGLSPEDLKYWYWVLNSLTHMSYSVCILILLNSELRKTRSKAVKISVLFFEDWCLLGAVDVYNQFTSNYNQSTLTQWIGFVVILLIQTVRYRKWKLNMNL